MGKSKSPTEWLDELFNDCTVALTKYTDTNGQTVTDIDTVVINTHKAKQAILNHIEELVGRIIGEDEMSHRVGFGGVVMGLTHKDINRNKLRAEQRTLAKQLLTQEED